MAKINLHLAKHSKTFLKFRPKVGINLSISDFLEPGRHKITGSSPNEYCFFNSIIFSLVAVSSETIGCPTKSQLNPTLMKIGRLKRKKSQNMINII